MTTTEKKLYEHLKKVLEALDNVFSFDACHTETQLFASLDEARREVKELELKGIEVGDEDVDWYNMTYLCKAMQGRSVEGVADWATLETAAERIANATRYLNAFETINDL